MQKIGINVRTFASQMTEYVVEHIEEALKTKQFPAYKDVFDRFTRIYVESQKVAVPMDILLMSLCECVTKNEDAIHISSTPLSLSLITTQDAEGTTENLQETPLQEIIETKIIEEPAPKEEIPTPQQEETSKKEPLTGIFKDDFIYQLGL